MRRITALSVILTIIFGMLTVPVTAFSADGDSEPQLYAADFDSGKTDGWMAFGDRCTLTVEEDEEGGYFLTASEREISWTGPSLEITDIAEQGSSLHITAKVRGNAQIMMTVKTVDTDGNEGYPTLNQQICSGDSWTELTGTYIIPSGLKRLFLYFQTAESTENISVDDVRITMIGGSVADIDSNGISSYSFDFEESAEGWMPSGDMSLIVTNKYSYSGTHSLYASNRTEYWNAPMVRVDVEPGIIYDYSACVMYNGEGAADEHRFTMKLMYTGKSGMVYTEIAGKTLRKGAWSKLMGEFTVPSGAHDAYLFIQTNEIIAVDTEIDSDDIMPFYIDNVSIRDCRGDHMKKKIETGIAIGIAVIVLCGIFFTALALIRSARESKALLLSARMDMMTGAFNRNAYEAAIEELQNDPERCRSIFVTVCDVNGLKNINDNYGHENGDRAIIRCASVLLKTIGKKGSVYRVGGDEFLCITSENLHDAILTEMTLESGKYKGYPFSAALGTSGYVDGEEPDIKAIIERSDKQMYEHKSSMT